jgi:hypothetical protein
VIGAEVAGSYVRTVAHPEPVRMPWELTLTHADPAQPLGPVTGVQDRLRSVLPGIEFHQDASGIEKLEAMEALGVEVPEVIRTHLIASQGSHQGVYEGCGFTIELFFGEGPTVQSVGFEVRGSGDPLPMIEQLMSIPEWRIADVDGLAPSREVWGQFRQWQDDAIDAISDKTERR